MTTATTVSANLGLPTVSLESPFLQQLQAQFSRVRGVVEKLPVLAAPTVVTETALWVHFAPPPQ